MLPSDTAAPLVDRRTFGVEGWRATPHARAVAAATRVRPKYRSFQIPPTAATNTEQEACVCMSPRWERYARSSTFVIRPLPSRGLPVFPAGRHPYLYFRDAMRRQRRPEDMAPSSLLNQTMECPMPQSKDDFSRSLVPLDQNSTVICAVDLSAASWLAGRCQTSTRKPCF